MSDDTASAVLPEAMQRRNSLVFLLNNSLYFLIAPIFYVGVLHATILDSLHAGRAIANLPETVFLWVTPLPVLIAWLWPSPRLLRPMLTACLVLNGAGGLLVAALFAFASSAWVIPALIAHAAIVGVCNAVRNMCLWELVGRGLSPERRARTLGWTFGLGPLLAVLGSCFTQLMLSGNFLDAIRMRPVPPPWNYALLFGATAPVMWLSAALVALAQVPSTAENVARARLADIVRGLRGYFLHPLIIVAALGFLLTYGGTRVMNNLSLFARDAIGAPPEQYAGFQLALRFGCKSIAGFALGWLVARLNAKTGLLATTAVCLAGVGWALLVPGKWYLLSFGLLGSGELFYIYYLNYIVGCSAPERIRENTAYTSLLTLAVGFMPLFYGMVSDRHGLRASFGVAAVLFVAALLIVALRLPRQPVAALP